jgi:polygalacturonase
MAIEYPRPRVINLYRCENVTIRDITIINSPSWTVHPVYCRNVLVDGIKIDSPGESPNTDGINPDSCQDVRIANCYITAGDDCITLKSGYNEYGRAVGIPCENIVITNCVMKSGHGGVVIGSEMSGDVRNITIDNCVFDGTDRGIRIKSSRGRGGVVEHLRADNLVARNVNIVLNMTLLYDRDGEAEEVNEGTPIFRDIHISNITGYASNKPIEFIGLPEMPIERVTIENVHLVTRRGAVMRHMRDVALRNVSIQNSQDAPVHIADASAITIEGLTTRNPPAGVPAVLLERVADAWVWASRPAPAHPALIELRDTDASEVHLAAPALSDAMPVFVKP